MKILLTFLLSVGLLTQAHAQTLSAGDIAFIVYNTDGNDNWAFVVLEDIPSGETINFTTNGWTGSAFYSNTEETLSVTTGAVVSAGTVVNVSSTTFSPNIGTVTGIALTPFAGDQILCYQGSISSPTFIAAIHGDYNAVDYNASTGWNTGSGEGNTTSSALPTGLTNGLNAISLFPGVSEVDNARYTGTLVGTKTELLAAINDRTQWTDQSNSTVNYTFTRGNFTVNASVVPAPEINVKQASTDITSGETHHFGAVQIGDLSEVVFTIENTGDANLDITSITPSGTGFSIQSGISANPVSASGSATFTVRFQPTSTSQTSGSVTIVSDDADEGSYVINFTTTVTNATLDIKVFLEGPFSGTKMSTSLNGVLPANPSTVYGSVASEISAGIPATAVDWVEVELRTGTAASTKVGTNRGGILKSNGSIVDKDGNAFTMSQVDGSSYYVVIHHRNHLSVMSAMAVSPSGGTYSFDFTTAQANNFNNGAEGAIQVGSVFAMVAGDADGNGTVNSTDLNTWRAQNGVTFTYGTNGKTDLNLDGVINAVDRNEYQQKNSITSSQVPNT